MPGRITNRKAARHRKRIIKTEQNLIEQIKQLEANKFASETRERNRIHPQIHTFNMMYESPVKNLP